VVCGVQAQALYIDVRARAPHLYESAFRFAWVQSKWQKRLGALTKVNSGQQPTVVRAEIGLI